MAAAIGAVMVMMLRVGGGGGGEQSFAVHDLGELCGSADPDTGKVTFFKTQTLDQPLDFDRTTGRARLPSEAFAPLLRLSGGFAGGGCAGGYAGVNAAAASPGPRHGWCASPRRRAESATMPIVAAAAATGRAGLALLRLSSTRIGRRGE